MSEQSKIGRQKNFLLKLFALIWPHRFEFGFGMLALLLASAINLALPQIGKFLIDQHFQDLVEQHPLLTASGFALVFAVQNLLFYYRSYLFSSVGLRVSNKIRHDLFASLLEKELSYHDVHDWADTRSRLLNDVQLVQDVVSTRLSVFLRYAVQVLAGAILMLWISPSLAALGMCAIPVLVLLGARFGRKLKEFSRRSQESLAGIGRDIDEGLGQIRLVKMLSGQRDLLQRFESHNQAVANAGIARARFAAFFASFVNFLLTLALLLVVLYGVLLVGNGQLTTGDLTAFLLYGSIVGISFAFVISSYTELVQASVAGDRIFSLLNSDQSQAEAASSSKLLRSDGQGNQIVFENVSFNYPARPQVEILSQLNLTIAGGTCIAIVGASGGGKSTLVALLLKLYDPRSGTIFLDGAPLSSLASSELLHQIAVVPQESPLFGISIRENLAFGNSKFDETEIWSVLEQCGIKAFVESQPQKLETPLGERGLQLSAGQRQRLAIARALLRKPKALILDEATSALDTENESRVLDLLAKLKGKMTIVIVSHRLSTLRIADRIVVLNKGSVAQDGSYEALVSAPGLFKSMLETSQVEQS